MFQFLRRLGEFVESTFNLPSLKQEAITTRCTTTPESAVAQPVESIDPLILGERNAIIGCVKSNRGTLSDDLLCNGSQLKEKLLPVLHSIGPDGIRHFFQLLDIPLNTLTVKPEDEKGFAEHAMRVIQTSIGVDSESRGKAGRVVLNYLAWYNEGRGKSTTSADILKSLCGVTSIVKRSELPAATIETQGIPPELVARAEPVSGTSRRDLPISLVRYHAMKWLDEDEIDALERIAKKGPIGDSDRDLIILLDVAVKEKIAERQNPKALPGELPLTTGDGSQAPQALH